MHDPHEAALLARVVRGDDRAFEALYALYATRVRHVAWRLCGRADLVDDLTNEAWCRAYRTIESYDATRPFLTWVFGILHNVWREQLREMPSGKVRSEQGENAELRVANEQSSSNASPDRLLAEAEFFVCLEECVAALAPADRELVRLRFFDGMTLRGVAQRVGVPEATLRERRIPEILDQLERCLRSKGVAEFFQDFSAHGRLRVQYPDGDGP